MHPPELKVAPSSPRPRRSRRFFVVVALGLGALLGLLSAACSRGSYPLDYFPEMHYSQSVRSQESPVRSAPSDAVPITGAEAPLSELIAISNPVPLTSAVLQHGAQLFQVNCSMCHGQQGEGGIAGNRFVAQRLRDFNANPPPSLKDSALVRTGTDGIVFSVLTTGIVVMPSFKDLLTEEERWVLVRYLKDLAKS